MRLYIYTHTDNLIENKKTNIGANLYSCFDIRKEVNIKMDNRVGSICTSSKQKELIYNSKYKKITNNERGITLLALAITIIIMLILAAVGVGLVVGDNGILSRTQKATKDSDESYVKEIVNTSYNSVAIEYGIGRATIAEFYANSSEGKGKIMLMQEINRNSRGKIQVISYNFENKIITIDCKYTKNGKEEKIYKGIEIYVGDDEEGANGNTNTTGNTTGGNNTNTSGGGAVDTIPVKGVRVQSSIVIEKGETAMLSAQIDPDNATNKNVTWKSNNTGVATVSSSGTVTAVGVGETNITVTTEDGNKTATCKVTVIQAGEITGEVTWSDGVASIKITTQAQGYTLQYQKNSNLDTGWSSVTSGEKIITINNLKHGDTIYARNYNNGTVKNIKSFDIQDLEDPVANINLSSNSTTKGVAVTADVTQTDSKSGIDISNCKWILNVVSTEIGEDATNYTNTFTSANEEINLSEVNVGIYYLHVLTVDYAGNSKETISSAISVANQNPTVTANLASKTTNSITVSVTGQDDDGDDLIATLYTKTSSGSYTAKGTANIAGGNGTQSITASGLSNYTNYTYYVTLTDNTETVQTTTATVRTYCPGTGHTAKSCPGTTSTSSTCGNCSGTGSISGQCATCEGDARIWQCGSCGTILPRGNSYIEPASQGDCRCYVTVSWERKDCPDCTDGTSTSRCSKCSGTGKITTSTPGCSHGKTESHYYCNTSGCTYTGSSSHCSHLKTSQHDN